MILGRQLTAHESDPEKREIEQRMRYCGLI